MLICIIDCVRLSTFVQIKIENNNGFVDEEKGVRWMLIIMHDDTFGLFYVHFSQRATSYFVGYL